MFNKKQVKALKKQYKKPLTKKQIWNNVNLFLCIAIDVILLCGLNQKSGAHIGTYLNQGTLYIWPLIASSYVQFVLGRWVYAGWYKEWFKSHTLGMDTLVGIGSIVPWIFSLVMACYGWHDMTINHLNYFPSTINAASGAVAFPPIFETGSTIVLVITIGENVNTQFEQRLGTQLNELSAQKAINANLITPEGVQVILAKDLKVEDKVVVKKGEIVPADGVLLSKTAAVDDKSFTGEPNYTTKKTGDILLGGSINTGEAFNMQITVLYKDSMINQLIKRVQKTQGTKLKVTSKIDEIAKWFTPIMIILAIFFFLIQYFCGQAMCEHGLDLLLPTGVTWTPANRLSIAIYYAVGVLVGSCPCVFGIAIPIVMTVSSTKFLKHGILLNKGKAFDAFKTIKTIAFDKTGTLTEGVFTVDHVHGNEDYLYLAYSLSKLSNHPISESLTKYVEENYKDVKTVVMSDVQELSGVGLLGFYNGDEYKIANLQYIQDNHIEAEFIMCPISMPLTTYSYLLKNNKVVLEIRFIDRIKPGTYNALKELKAKGYEIYLITGDNKKNAEFLKQELGFNEVYAEVLPTQKQEIVKKIQEKRPLIYVGDGLNDIAALQQADISIAMSSGNSLSKSVSDFIVLDNDLKSVIDGIKIVKQGLKTINANLIWAAIYNLIVVPLSGIGILMPIISSSLMFFSDFILTTNGAIFGMLPLKWRTNKDKNYAAERTESELVKRFKEANNITE